MGYYMGVSMMQPRALIGARGGFFSGIAHFLGGAVQRLAPAMQVMGGQVGRAGTALSAALGHPVVSGAAAAATGTAIGAAVAHHYGGAATIAAPGGLTVHGHLHVGGRGKRAAPAMGGPRRRRMNVCNPRALRRAIRRAHGFEHFARKVISFPFHNRKAKRGVFKRKRRTTPK